MRSESRGSTRGNAVYAALSAVGVAVIVLGRRANGVAALLAGIAMFLLCFSLLTLLMHYVRRRQEAQNRELEED